MRRDFTLRSFLGLLVALLVPAGAAFAQTATVRGTVVDQNGDPLPGAAIRIVDTTIGAQTNADGEYSITNAPLGEQTVIATFVGFVDVDEVVNLAEGDVVVVDFVLQGGIELGEISVDALGFAQNTDQLGTSQSSVDGEALTRSGETSVLRALSAKAPGINVTAAGGDPGASTRIVIRGQNSIQGDNQPLIVIDGVPVFNTSFANGVEGVQQQSRLNDLNPEDIQSVEVLRSASAAALWGSRAQAGVIVITTKKGQAGRANRPTVSFSTRVSIDELNQAPDLQTAYGQGNGGRYSFVPGGGRSWGDRIELRPGGEDTFITDPNAPGYLGFAEGLVTGRRYYAIPDGTAADPSGGKNSQDIESVYDDIFQNGFYLDNNLTVSGNDANGQYFLSAGFLGQDGIVVENSNLERASVRLNAERNLSTRLSVNGQASYVRSTSDRIQQGSNLAGLFLGGLRQSNDFDAADYLVDYYPTGEGGLIFRERQRAYRNPLGANTGSVYDNPLFTVNRNLNTSRVNRFQGQVGSVYNVNDWINVNVRLGSDYYTDRQFYYYPLYASEGGGGGEQDELSYTQFQLNGDVIGRAERDLTDDISGSLLLGLNLNHRETDFVGSNLSGFTLPIYPFGADLPYRSLGNGANEDVTGRTGQSVRRTLGYYSEAGLDLYDQLFLNLTGRFDQASTFGPESDDLFFYPSASIAWQFTELLGEGAGPLSFGKLRASYGEVGAEPDPYLAFTYFFPQTVGDGYVSQSLSAAAYGGGFARSLRLGSPIIDPERKTEFEVGGDLRFFGDRLSASAVYYNNETDNAILNLDVAPSRGFTSQTANGATISNEGIELSLDAAWPSVGDFNWNTYASWWTNENTVKDLSGVQEVFLSGFADPSSSLIAGQPFASLFGTRWRRAMPGCDTDLGDTPEMNCEPLTEAEKAAGFSVNANDNFRVLDDNGFPVPAESQGLIGDPNPDWRASIGNTLRFKDLSLNVLFDASIGGDVYNGTQAALSFFGRAGYQDWWTNVSAAEATSLVDWTGQTVAQRCGSATGACTRGDIVRNDDGSYNFRGYVENFGSGPVIVNEYYYRQGPGSNFTGPSEPWVEDGSFVRLRELTLSYNWADAMVQRLGISSINFALTGRNLLLFTDYDGIDPETNLTGAGNGQGIDYFNNPSSRSYQFSVRFTY